MQLHPLAAIALMESEHLQRQMTGTDSLKDELALVDLGFMEKRFGRPIKLATDRQMKILALRQHCALLRIQDRPSAYCNRAASIGRLLSHPKAMPRPRPNLRAVK